MLKNLKFCILTVMGAMATFPIFVPPFLLPLYADSIGLSSGTGSAILATWNFSSAIGRVMMGLGADSLLGPVNSLFISLLINGLSIMAIWPVSTSVGILVLFAILNGVGSGGFFSLIPVVIGWVFGTGLVANAFSMLVTAYSVGYFMVCEPPSPATAICDERKTKLKFRERQRPDISWKAMAVRTVGSQRFALLYFMLVL